MESLEDRDRRVIPRWRDFGTTVRLGELASADRTPGERPVLEITDRLAEWREHPTLWHAADLVGAAIVTGRTGEAIEGARAILEDPKAPPGARALAERVFSLENVDDIAAEIPSEELLHKAATDQIRRLRKRLVGDPRNAIALVEIARNYMNLGLPGKARTNIDRALALAGDNRFVLRSAARFFVHRGDFDRADWLLSGSEATSTDPWLLAAEIAVASAGGKTSRFAKGARKLLERKDRAPRDTSELSSAVASLELDSGKAKAAKRLFRESLVAPTDNSVAQATWASRHLPGLLVESAGYHVPRNYEADALESVWNGEWRRALGSGLKWLGDQSFSSRPAILASFVAATALEDYKTAIAAAMFGLKRNPTDWTLLNNYAFSLALIGDTKKADEIIRQAVAVGSGRPSGVTLTATQGLIEFRRGNPAEGRRLYEAAIETAQAEGLRDQEAMARIYLAMEEIRAGSPSRLDAVSLARSAAELARAPYIRELERRLEEAADGRKPSP